MFVPMATFLVVLATNFIFLPLKGYDITTSIPLTIYYLLSLSSSCSKRVFQGPGLCKLPQVFALLEGCGICKVFEVSKFICMVLGEIEQMRLAHLVRSLLSNHKVPSSISGSAKI